MAKKKKFKDLPVGDDAIDTATLEFHRPRWKHYMRWLFFCFVVFLYLTLILKSYNSHFLLHHGFDFREVLAYFICSLMLIPIVPSVLLEVDYVKADDTGLTLQNLLLRRIESWENVKRFDNPRFLKFAILRTRGFVYLLNRRDLSNFEKLVETIEEKTSKLLK